MCIRDRRCWAGRASEGAGPLGGDLPWAAAISTTELGTVWEPDANPWARASALNLASFPLPNMRSAQWESIQVSSKDEDKYMGEYANEANK